ncbi:lantibiotic dehydratase [Streptomyces sp. Da 82-17]|uniref:lantibiotic dehydratase n=1 Tax=Streptomyces sp. Da 82-17 TaxID=3377116 RepID=UPI0038D42023
MTSSSETLYRAADTALVRASRHTNLLLPAWPGALTSSSPEQLTEGRAWLREVWSQEEVAEAIEHASPLLARQVEALCSTTAPDARQLRRALLSVTRYVLRMTGRATPHGLFAGVAAASFEPQHAQVTTWGELDHAVVRADGAWLADVISRLESCPELLWRLPVLASTTVFVRGDRLVIPYPPRSRRTDPNPPTEVSIRCTGPVRTALDAARATPIRVAKLADRVAAEFPKAAEDQVRGLLATLVDNGALISSLYAPSGVFDALDHLVRQVEEAGGHEVPQVADLVEDLRAVRDGMEQHNQALTAADGRRLRRALREKMTTLSDAVEQPIAVDLRVGCRLVLPQTVAWEAERAATALARLSAMPFGTPGWKDFHNRFFERYGIGSLVPLRDVVDADTGLGFPAGYLDAEPEPREALTQREQKLLALAQAAVLDGRDEIELDEDLINDLAIGDRDAVQVPPHLEFGLQIQAASLESLFDGNFALTAISPSRGIGTTTGRFLNLLYPKDRERATAVFDELPTNTPGALPAQLSFSPLTRGDSHVTRTPELMPAVISLAEHRTPDAHTIALDDLAVGCDRRRLYLVSLSRGQVVEPQSLHALNLRSHTPPLARFLAEISRSAAAVVTPFPWGAALNLPFLPRVRYGRTILSPARWRLDRADLPGRQEPWEQWHKALDAWRTRRRVPKRVALTEGDRVLPLDLTEPAHLAVLRAHLANDDAAILTEVGPEGGWLGGRAHEIVVPLTATRTPKWPTVPPVTADRVLARDHGYLPGASPWLLVKLYGHVERHPEILARHLPRLLTQWDEEPAWWYMRYRDPRWHLRLRIAVPEPAEFGPTATRVSEWAAGLRREGLLSDVQFATSYPETGRWGTGESMRLAEEVFAADSRALAVQFAQPHRPHRQVLAAANFISLAAAFTGSTVAGIDWLITHGRIKDPTPLDRAVLKEAVRLADPSDDFESLRNVPGGAAINDAWAERDKAIARYRAQLDDTEALVPDLVLDSLLHGHHIRAAGIDKDDERTCIRLARAAALAWKHGGANHGPA